MLKNKILNSFRAFKNFRYVSVEEGAIEVFIKKHRPIIKSAIKTLLAEKPKYDIGDIKQNLNFLFILRVLDFSLWLNNRYLYRNLRDNFKQFLFHCQNLADIVRVSLTDFRRLLKLTEPISISKKRLRLIRASIYWLEQNYRGQMLEMFERNLQPEKFVFKLAELKKFQDWYKINESPIYIFKPNQLLYFECSLFLKELKPYLSELTVFPDYRLPAILNHYGILAYSQSLRAKIKQRKELHRGSRAEIELRIQTIRACEMIAQKLNVPSWQVDQLLWLVLNNRNISVHRTKTIFY